MKIDTAISRSVNLALTFAREMHKIKVGRNAVRAHSARARFFSRPTPSTKRAN